MNGMSLTVIIPTRHRADLLALCLESLRHFATPDTEIIVVDDGSPRAIASRTLAASGVRARVIRFPTSRGFCAAANAGIAGAKSAIVQLLNDDAQVTANWAAPALDAFANSDVVAVAPLVLRWPAERTPPIIDSAGDSYDRGGFAFSRGRGMPLSEEYLTALDVDAVSGSAGFFRRSAVLSVGGFPDSFVSYFEDVDLSCRLRRAGGRIVYTPLSRVLHRGSSSHRRTSPRLVAQQSCNEERLFWRNCDGNVMEVGRHAAVLLAKATRRISEGRIGPWLAGRCRAWRTLRTDLQQGAA